MPQRFRAAQIVACSALQYQSRPRKRIGRETSRLEKALGVTNSLTEEMGARLPVRETVLARETSVQPSDRVSRFAGSAKTDYSLVRIVCVPRFTG